jgi:hypothetical protein
MQMTRTTRSYPGAWTLLLSGSGIIIRGVRNDNLITFRSTMQNNLWTIDSTRF